MRQIEATINNVDDCVAVRLGRRPDADEIDDCIYEIGEEIRESALTGPPGTPTKNKQSYGYIFLRQSSRRRENA